MPTRKVVLTDRDEMLLEDLVSSGRYLNADEVLHEGLQLIALHNVHPDVKLAALRAAIQEGIDDIEAGRYRVFDNGDELDVYLAKISEAAIVGTRKAKGKSR